MIMDPRFENLSSVDDFNFENHIPLLDPNQFSNTADGFKSNEPAVGFDSFAVPLLSIGLDALTNMPKIPIDDPDRGLGFLAGPDGGSFYPSVSLGSSLNAGGESPSSPDDSDSSCPILKHIGQMLMEENMEEKVWISPNDLALQNTEKSLYDALGEQYPYLPNKLQDFDASQFIWSPNGSLFGNSGKKSSVGTTTTNTNYINSIYPNWLHDPGEYIQTATLAIHPLGQVPQLNLDYSSPFFASSVSNSIDDTSGLAESSILAKNNFNDNDFILQFKRGLEEASKFLPPSSQLVINFDNASSGSWAKRGILGVGVHDNEGGSRDTLSGSRGTKNRGREDHGLVEARATKQTASYVEEEEAVLSDMLDKVLLCTEKAEPLSSTRNCLSTDASKDLQTSAQRRRRRQENNSSVDLRALLILCAQALSSNDLRTANELVTQIREKSSPSGDGSQRLAYHFANGLEARMAGNLCGTQSFYASAASKRRSIADVLKAYQLHFSSCPFKRLSIFYMNCMIWKMLHKATDLHIIDFGIGLGFKWPILIQKLGEQAGGSPKLRITGIELPQPGFRPAQRIEETGCRLARYCKRFNVPFEYNALPSLNWEAIKIEDLKIHSGETIAVTCLMRFENLLDETVEEDSPRDAVLNLIRRIKPDVFVHAFRNGSYDMPFFVTRFKEALFHLSSIYDMYDATICGEHKDSKERTDLENEFYGRQVMNVVACEGSERVERPETYKQWQARHSRAGFKQLPLDQEMMKKFRHKLDAWYHKDFVLEEDGDWMLLGWKGRIMEATTCLLPI